MNRKGRRKISMDKRSEWKECFRMKKVKKLKEEEKGT